MSLDDYATYLEDDDFDGNKLLFRPNKPVVCLVYADFCGHCVSFKPTFTKFAQKMKDTGACEIVCIKGDGKDTPGQEKLSKMIPKLISNFRGYPTVLKYKDGNLIEEYQGDRSLNSLEDFVN